LNRDEEIKQALSHPCVVDTNILSNFIHTGQAHLLNGLISDYIYLPPTVLDEREAIYVTAFREREARSEFLKPIYKPTLKADSLYQEAAPHIEKFTSNIHRHWEPIELTVEELALANHVSSRAIRKKVRKACPDIKGRVELGPGEAECVAVAASRKWTLLVDDQAAVNLVRCLYPSVVIIRTCELLAYAAKESYLTCENAANLFNDVIVDKHHFYAYSGNKRLWLRCNPPKCKWGEI